MIFSRSHARSEYMEFAKLRSGAKYNLATSGMSSYPLAALDVKIDELEINPSSGSGYGYAPLIDAIAKRYRVQPDCVLPAAGTSLANYYALAATTDPGDKILVEQPTYTLLLDTARYLGLEIRRFARRPENDYGIDLDDVRKNLTSRTKLIVLCNLHNPTGALLSDATLRELGAIAKAAGARVLVDEVYLEMLFTSEPPSAVHLDPEVFIGTNSLTKAYGLSGIRCGWVLASPEVTERMWHIHDLHSATNVYPAEQLSVIAFEKLPQIAEKNRLQLEANRALLHEFLKDQSTFEYFWPELGTVVFPRPIGKSDSAEFCERLRNEFELSVVPGRFFEDPARMRIGVGGETAAVQQNLEQLQRALKAFR